MRASVCIVTYNNENTIEKLLSTLYEHCEADVWISDNDSSDRTLEIVRKNFPMVNIIENHSNKGFGHGQNAVLDRLSSDMHFIINPDIIFEYDVIGDMCRFFDENPDIVMAVPKFLYENGEEQFTPKLSPKVRYMVGGRFERFGGIFRKWRYEYTMRDRTVTEPVDIGFCSGCFIAVRTEIFKKIGGFDERYFLYNEDADITRMAGRYGRTVYAPQFSVVHLWERAYMKNKKYFLIQIDSMIKYFWKWRSGGRYVK